MNPTHWLIDETRGGMAALLHLDQKNPVATGAIGAVSGAFAWLLEHLPSADSVVVFLIHVGTFIVIALTIAVKVWNIVRTLRKNRTQRRRHRMARLPDDSDPPELYDDLP